MKTYTLRRIDPDLWTAVKRRAGSEGREIRFVMLELLKVYARHGFDVVEAYSDRRKK